MSNKINTAGNNNIEEKTISSHSITLENRRKMMLTAIIEVVSATDNTIIAKTNNKVINIIGKQLRVAKLNLEEGLFIVEGEIDCFKYVEQAGGKSFFKRMFK